MLVVAFLCDKILHLIIAFLCGYCFGYFLFDKFRKKSQKEEIEDFFFFLLIKNMASKEGGGENPLLVYKLGKIEIKDENFLGVDLSVEKNFLEGLMDSLGENMKDCAVSYYLSRRCFGICCETFVLTANTARKLLTVIDEQISEIFF